MVVTDEVVYMPADVEDEYIVAQANEPLDEKQAFCHAKVSSARRDEFLEIDRRGGRLHGRFSAHDGCIRRHGDDPLPGETTTPTVH